MLKIKFFQLNNNEKRRIREEWEKGFLGFYKEIETQDWTQCDNVQFAARDSVENLCIWWDEAIVDLWGGFCRRLSSERSKKHVWFNSRDVWVSGDELCWFGVIKGEWGNSGGFEEAEDTDKVLTSFQKECVSSSWWFTAIIQLSTWTTTEATVISKWYDIKKWAKTQVRTQ